MNKSNSGHKLSEIDKKESSGVEENEKCGGPISNKDFGHVTNKNKNKNTTENEKGWSCQAKSRQSNRVSRPEKDRQNVAFYKKRLTFEDREKNKTGLGPEKTCQKLEVQMVAESSNEKEKEKLLHLNVVEHATNITWAAVASMSPKQEKSTIDPLYLGEEPGFDRIVVRPTHFNKTVFDGFITCAEADLIQKAINLEENVHGTSFYRNKDGILFITFKLVSNLTIEEIRKTIKKYFRFGKTSSKGHLDSVSGEVVHPSWNGPDTDPGNQVQKPEITEIRIEGCNYQLTEEDILSVLDGYGATMSEMEEVAMVTPNGELGTGTYTMKIKLDRDIPNIIPMYGLKIKVSHKGTKKQCAKCFDCHKMNFKCARKPFQQYIDEFMVKYAPAFPLERKVAKDQDFSYEV